MISVSSLQRFPMFADVALEVVGALARRGVEISFAPSEVVFLSGSAPRGWYIVLEGNVRVVRGSGTRQHVVHTEGAGGSLGEVPLFGGGTHPAIGEAPCIAFIVAGRLADRVRRLVERLDDRSARSVQARLIEHILGRRSERSASISLGMTQQALAEELGTVREVVSREIRVLVRRGWIEPIGGGRYRLVDVDELRAAAG